MTAARQLSDDLADNRAEHVTPRVAAARRHSEIAAEILQAIEHADAIHGQVMCALELLDEKAPGTADVRFILASVWHLQGALACVASEVFGLAGFLSTPTLAVLLGGIIDRTGDVKTEPDYRQHEGPLAERLAALEAGAATTTTTET